MQASTHDDINELSRLYDKLNLTGRVIRVGRHNAFCGGYADVWQARLIPRVRRGKFDVEDGEKVAVKVIREVGSGANEASLRRRLVREIRAWSALHHRNVLPLYGFTYGFSPGSCLASLVSPWMPNGTARKYLEKRSVSERIRVLTGVADGLYYLHRHDVVHGDLKGENIMIDMNYEPRIADFGLSKLLDEVSSTLTMTLTGNAFGSVRWTAPELISSPGIDKPCDVWSFGMTVLELFTNSHPYDHYKRDPQVIVALHREELPHRPTSKHWMPDPLWDLCCDCWSSNPEVRPTSQVVAKRLWDLDLKCKLMSRRKRRAPPSPDRKRDAQRQVFNETRKEEEQGGERLRKSPKLSSLSDLVGDSLPSPGTTIPIHQSITRRTWSAPRTPRTPASSSRSTGIAHSRTYSISSSSHSRRSSRGDFPSDFDPRRILMHSGTIHSDGHIFASHQLASPMRRTQTEPTGLDLHLEDRASFAEFGNSSALAVSTPRRNIHSSFGIPDQTWSAPGTLSMPYDAVYATHMGLNGSPHSFATMPNTYAAAPSGYATPPIDFAAPPMDLQTPPMGWATPPDGTPQTALATPPGWQMQLHQQSGVYQQQPMPMASINDFELLQQSHFLGGFDADEIYQSQEQWRNFAYVSSLPLQQYEGNGSLLFDSGVINGVDGTAFGQNSSLLLPPPSHEDDSFGSLSPYYSPSLMDNAFPSPHALGQLFSENFVYEEQCHSSPLFQDQPIRNSPQSLHLDLSQKYEQTHQRPSGTVDFESMQQGIFSPAMSDVSAPDMQPTPSLLDTPLISGFEDAFAFESEDEGEDLDGSQALIGGLDISGEFSINADIGGTGTVPRESGSQRTPHASPRPLGSINPLTRSADQSQSSGTITGAAIEAQMPPTPTLSPFPLTY